MTRVRWGIAGPGKQAAAMVADFGRVTTGELVAVGSRSQERAAEFAGAHGIPRAHGSYADLAADPGVDAIYIATPHPQHTDIALEAIAAGKAILVEKAFTASVEDTERIIEAARTAGVFAMEAMWTRFNPGVVRLRELIAEGAIGEVRGVHGDLTAFREFVPTDRLFDPALGGGAVLDLGVYVLSFAQHLLGVPDVVHAVGGTFATGVESDFSVLLGYADGRSATLSGGFTTYGPGRMMVLGTQGWIDVHPRFHRAPALTVWRGRERIADEEFAFGFEHEVDHVGECLAAGLSESPVMPLTDTLAVQRLMADVLSRVRGR
ncbi:MAG: Gfo/Idh/MocA family oxidoreductase [Dermatophilaceae bacterium]